MFNPPILSGALAMTSGDGQSCALVTNGRVFCWVQRNAFSALFPPRQPDSECGTAHRNVGYSGKPPGIPALTSVRAGGRFGCAVTLGGGLLCWGIFPDIAHTPAEAETSASPLRGESAGTLVMPRVKAVASGSSHLCVQFVNGTWSCWGDNTYGQLGMGTTAPRPLAASVPYPTAAQVSVAPLPAKVWKIVASSASAGHSCGITGSDGELWCCGSCARALRIRRAFAIRQRGFMCVCCVCVYASGRVCPVSP